MAKSLLELILDLIMDEEWMGKRGETLTTRKLNVLHLMGRKGKILRNVYIPKDNGGTSEIDVLFITQKGMFVIESKNYSGWIFGDEASQYWTAMLPNRQKNRFYNPISQNRTHIKWLKNFLKEDVPTYSLIVFSERCKIKKMQVRSADVHVLNRDALPTIVREIWSSTQDVLTEVDIERLYSRLQPLTEVTREEKQEHVDHIRKRYGMPEQNQRVFRSQEPEVTAEETVKNTTPVCPRCGEKLILRTAKKGANAGNQFWGCSNYPKCRYIENIEKA